MALTGSHIRNYLYAHVLLVSDLHLKQLYISFVFTFSIKMKTEIPHVKWKVLANTVGSTRTKIENCEKLINKKKLWLGEPLLNNTDLHLSVFQSVVLWCWMRLVWMIIAEFFKVCLSHHIVLHVEPRIMKRVLTMTLQLTRLAWMCHGPSWATVLKI